MSNNTDKLMKDIPRGVPSRYLNQQNLPFARFQDPERLIASQELSYDPDNPGKKILAGAIGDTLIGIEDDRHWLNEGGSRSGKSVQLEANLMLYPGSVLATDPKAELANITAQRRADLGQKVHVLDPFNQASDRIGEFRARYNPMSVLALNSPTIIEDAHSIADSIVVQSPNTKDPHWDESAKNFIEGTILQVATDPKHEGRRHLVTVRELIIRALQPDESDEDSGMYLLEREMLENAVRLCQDEETADLGHALEGASRGFYDMEGREQANVHSNVRRHTKFLDYPAIRKTVTGHDFDLTDLKTAPKGVSIYLCFPATRIEVCNRWLRIFVNQLLGAMERERINKTPAPVLVCLDEFPVLGYMRQLEDAAGLIASFDVKLWIIVQDWGQIKALYKDRAETFIGNMGVIQAFGINDVVTAEYLSKKLGKTKVEVSRSGEVGPDQRERGMIGHSSAIEVHDLMTAEEISRFFARSDPQKRQLVLWAGYHPMILQRIEYWDEKSPLHKFFKGKYAAPV